METPVGSLVAPSPSYREQMGTGEGAAILLAIRRGSGHVYYPATDRGYWVPMRQVGRIPPKVVPKGSLERFLSDLILFVDADECVIDEGGPDRMRLTLEVPVLGRDELLGLQAWLGGMLKDIVFEPGSMKAIILRFELVSLPPPASGVR